MKTQFNFLLIVACINIAIFVVMAVTTTSGDPIIPGMNYTSPINGTGSITDYEERMNATGAFEDWQDTQDSGYFNIGDVFSGLSRFVYQFRFLYDGIPALLEWCGSFIPVSTVAFEVVAWGFRIITAIMISTLVIEFISGRELMP